MTFSNYESEDDWKEVVWEQLGNLKNWIREYKPNLSQTFTFSECNTERRNHYWVEVTGRSNYEYLEPGLEDNDFRHFYCEIPFEKPELIFITTAIGDDCPRCIDLDEEDQDECEWCEGGRYFQVELFGLLSAESADKAWEMAFDLDNH
ncbi:MAG: hypothetical protein EBW15_07435 [Actinobacteria bacterium]|nr:hypothetical protein [Actinomycetota bacterium]